MKTPILETERLILRPITVADAEEIYTNWASDPDVAIYMTWSTHPNVEVTKGWLTEVEKGVDSDTGYDWCFVRKSDNKIIGSGGLYYKEAHDCFDLGYNTMKECWRQGYTTEAAGAMAEFAFKTLKQTKICACHAKPNPNSGKVMEKLGFYYVQDGAFDSIDGTKHYETREYVLEAANFRNPGKKERSGMLHLKEANLEDIEKEYLFVRDLPVDENGFTNEWHGISREDFEETALIPMIAYAKGEMLPEGYVPETFLFLWDDEEIVGQFRIRHYLCPSLVEGAGHIGYFINKSHRGKGYAKEGLRMTLQVAKTIVPEDEIYLRVNKDNPASLHVMLHNGGYVHHEDESKYYVRIRKSTI